ncbi:hypothetical protein LO762_28430 [Actinocorallia sp. API 0066]|uniref:DUF6879 family protein n=1 Tax=Actinocorallia sp. API 0066 TaxID=2896846 RepID=UPI001E314DA3|nr:DUF6879 family protein [Actinocorallia sp. API 0066]MCD0453080.1 hypothetical protein [Actinocorallia sp. API 0066]
MDSISVTRRAELVWGAREIDKLELLDRYPVDRELLDAWRAGDTATTERVTAVWRDKLAEQTAAGTRWRRVRVVSEPLSEYQRMAVAVALPDEDLRWLPRRLVSAVALPGNDCFVLDGMAVVFNVHDGDGARSDIQYSKDPVVATFCRAAFDRAWALALPTDEYRAH